MTTTLQLTLGEALRLMRERAGFNQAQLGDYLELSRNTVNRYESGATQPKWKDVKSWAEICDHDPQIVRELWELGLKSGCIYGGPPPDDGRYQQLSWVGGSPGNDDMTKVATAMSAA
jgi:transcriptional regulator with XRE-family HTH domain